MSKPADHLLDIYSAWLHCAGDTEAWAKLCRRIDSLDLKPNALGYTNSAIDSENSDTHHVSIYIDVAAHDAAGDKRLATLAETIAHEAAHAAGLILGHVGHKIRAKDEPHAYLVGWITAWLWQNVKGV